MEKISTDDETLSEMFDRGLRIHSNIEESTQPSNSDEFQHEVKKAILLLEDATRLVSLLDVFSRNEVVGEVKTEHLKYFLLPVLLGELNAKLADLERLEVIKVVEAYLVDFLQRVNEYEIVSVQIPSIKDNEESSGIVQNKRPDLAQMNRERDEKIRQFKERKEVESQLKELKLAVEQPSCDEEIVRSFYLKLIKKFTYSAVEDLKSFESEKPILRHMAEMKAKGGGIAFQPPKQATRPLKPIIITRDAIQKEVFGMGYKNLPVYTVEEFYEKRAREGWYSNPEPQQAGQPGNEDDEGRVRDAKEDADDEEELAKARARDEYNDDHRRGEGNRHNKG